MGKSAFVGVLNNKARDRHFGGTASTIVADPYITGYHYIKWLQLPTKLSTYVGSGDGKHMDELKDEAEIKKFLESSCLSVTPPGGTLNKTEFTGIGGIKWSVPTNIDYTNSVSVKFLEFTHLPVANIIHAWVRMIRDYKTGTSHLNEGDSDYTKSAYAGTMLYWTTKPDGRTVEYSAAYTGMFPSKDPQDLFTSDVTSIDKLEVEIEFNVDWIWHENWVHDKAQTEADTIYASNNPTGGYRGDDKDGDGTDTSVSK